jgi:hypothetical protein
MCLNSLCVSACWADAGCVHHVRHPKVALPVLQAPAPVCGGESKGRACVVSAPFDVPAADANAGAVAFVAVRGRVSLCFIFAPLGRLRGQSSPRPPPTGTPLGTVFASRESQLNGRTRLRTTPPPLVRRPQRVVVGYGMEAGAALPRPIPRTQRARSDSVGMVRPHHCRHAEGAWLGSVPFVLNPTLPQRSSPP